MAHVARQLVQGLCVLSDLHVEGCEKNQQARQRLEAPAPQKPGDCDHPGDGDLAADRVMARVSITVR